MRQPIPVALLLVCQTTAGAVRAQDVTPQPAEGARARAEAASVPNAPAQTVPAPSAAAPSAAAPVAPPPTVPAPSAAAPSAAAPVAPPPSARAPAAPQDEPVPSYEAHAVVPAGEGTLREEERIGSYEQPRWTARRRFPTTRVYVRPEGTFALEWWLRLDQSLKDADVARYRSQYELEMGLGHRLQLDVYLETEQEGHQAPMELRAEKLEVRWALADWGVILLNPTLYAEFIRMHDGPPKLELKALLGEELAPRWHFGFNLVFERELGGALENEYAAVAGLSYTIADDLFALGAEVKAVTNDVAGDRLAFDAWALFAGPSLSWRPVPPMHVLLVTLFGQETEGPEKTGLLEALLVLGWEL